MAIWRHFNKFLLNLDRNVISKSWEQKVALFGAYLVDKGNQSTTIKSYFSAIKCILKADGYEWDDSKVLLNILTRGCRLKNDTVKTRFPIQIRLLELLLFEVEREYGGRNGKNPQPYLESMYKAIYILMYYGMLRVGEIAFGPHVIKAANIHVGSNKNKILIILYSSKTHGKESKPQRVKISAIQNLSDQEIYKRKRFFCPFVILRQFANIRGDYQTDDEQFFVFADGSPIYTTQVRSILRKLLDNLNLQSNLYDTTSIRSGRATDMLIFGYSVLQIKEKGRWRSSAIYRYLRP